MDELEVLKRRWLNSRDQDDFIAYARWLSRVRERHVYLTYRCQYLGPRSMQTVAVQGNSILEWYQITMCKALVAPNMDLFYDQLYQDLKMAPQYLGSSFMWAVEQTHTPVPANWSELIEFIKTNMYSEHEPVYHSESCLCLLTDDDDIDMTLMFYTSDWARQNSHLCAFQLLDQRPVPSYDPAAVPSLSKFQSPVAPDMTFNLSQQEGFCYLHVHSYDDNGNYEHGIGVNYLFSGLRLPEFIDHVPHCEWTEDDYLPRAMYWSIRFSTVFQRTGLQIYENCLRRNSSSMLALTPVFS